MAPVVVKCVVSYSSQDPVHKLDNLLTAQGGNWKRWLCASADRSGVMEAELQLDRAYHIGYVDIGNCGSAYVELLVGRSSWPRSREYVTLLPATMFMNPMESRAGKNKMVVRMFNESLLSEEGRSEMWDRVRIICRQPFRKDLQFGLSFLRLRTPDTEVSSPPRVEVPSVTKVRHNSSSRRESTTSTAPTQASATETSGSTEWNEAIESTKSRLLKMAGTSEDGSEHLGRSARMVVAAASRQKNRHSRQADRTTDTPTGVVNQFEILKFLGSLDFSKMDVDTVMYSDLKMQYKQVLGRKLTAEEKRVFFQTTQQYLEQYFSQNKDSENREQANGHSTNSPEVETVATESVTILRDTSSKTNTPQNTRKRGGKGKQPRLPTPVTTTTSTVEVNNANQTNTPQSTRKRGGKGKQPMLPTPVTTTTSTVEVNNAGETNTPQSTRKRGGKGKQPRLPTPVTTTMSTVEVNNANRTNTPQSTRKRAGKGKQPRFPTPLKTSSTVEVNNADSALTGRQLRASFLASVVDRRGGNQQCEQADITAEASCSKPTPRKRGRRATSAAGSAKKRPKRCNRSMYPVGDTQVEEDEPSCSQSSCGSTGASDTLAECPICEGKYPSYIIEAHASECTGDSPDDDLPSPSKPCGSERDDHYTPPTRLVACPLCALRFPPSVIQDHANACADRDVICVF